MLVVSVAGTVASASLSIANGSWGGDDISMMVAFMAFMAVGAMIVARRPRNTLGWVFCAVGLLAATGSFAMEYAHYAYVTRRGAMPASVLAAWYASWFWYPLIILVLLYTLMLFPTGRLPSPRWRTLWWGAAVLTAGTTGLAALMPTLGLQDIDDVAIPNPIGVAGVPDPEDGLLGLLGLGIGAACMVGAVLSLLVRYRRSQGQERLQLKWFAYAATLVVFITLSEDLWEGSVPEFAFGAVITLLPGAVGVAVLRYRLYAIDRIISRTVSYATLTVLLAGVYLVVVTAATMLAPGARTSPLAVAASTLAAAALFGPARTRVQRAVDRRFDRNRYDAVRVVEEYRRHVRAVVNLDAVSGGLVDAARRSVHPTTAGVWLRTGSR